MNIFNSLSLSSQKNKIKVQNIYICVVASLFLQLAVSIRLLITGLFAVRAMVFVGTVIGNFIKVYWWSVICVKLLHENVEIIPSLLLQVVIFVVAGFLEAGFYLLAAEVLKVIDDCQHELHKQGERSVQGQDDKHF